MRRRIALVAAVTAVALSAGGALAPSAQATYCGTISAPGFHAFQTKTRNYSCRAASRTLKGWFRANARPSSGPRGWRCRRSYTGRARCTRGRATINFVYHKVGR